jgi:hypothetical protein
MPSNASDIYREVCGGAIGTHWSRATDKSRIGNARTRTQGNDRELIRAAAAFTTFWSAHVAFAGVRTGSDRVLDQIDDNTLAPFTGRQ